MEHVKPRLFAISIANAIGWLMLGALWLLAVLPGMVWIAIVVHAWRAQQYLGYWPSYNHPDPKVLPPYLLRETIELSVALILAVLLSATGIIATRRKHPATRAIVALLAGVLIWGISYFLAWQDPGNFVDWYFD